MKLEKRAKIEARDLLLHYGLPRVTLEHLIYILEDLGYELLEYTSQKTNDAVHRMMAYLNLSPLAQKHMDAAD